jgi:hypothetical protein
MLKIRSLGAVSLLAIGAISLSAAQASAKAEKPEKPAAPVLCTAGTVTASGFGSSTGCIGSFAGNDVTNGVPGGGDDPLLDQLTTGVFGGIANWTFLEKVDAPGTAGSVFSWNETSEGNGTWNVSSAITSPFVLSLKAGNAWSAYYFANNGTSITNGFWNTLGVALAGNGTNGKALSHASIFVASGQPPTRVPEPATVAALGLFVVSSLGVLKRKQEA